jgi:phosphate transport system substrate-binding protein
MTKTRRIAFTVAAGLGSLALLAAGCGGSEPVSGQDGQGQGGGTAVLNGSGSTFQEPIVVQWTGDFHTAHPDVQVNYQGIGSGGGIEQFSNGITEFGGTDAPMSDDELATAKTKGGDVLHIPIALGAVVPTYNLPGVDELKLDGPTLGEIFLGKITKWNDQKIAALNGGASLPGDDIRVVHRSDSSGTTYVFTGYLSKVSPDWESQVGQDKAPEWPTGIGGEGNDGVAAAIQQTEGSIGYNELAYAAENDIPYARLKNANGDFADATLDSTSAAGQGIDFPDDLRFDLLNSEAEGAWPIVSATWQLVWKSPATVGMSRDKARALAQWLTWELTDGQKSAPDLQYAALPKDLQAAAQKKVDEMEIPGA